MILILQERVALRVSRRKLFSSLESAVAVAVVAGLINERCDGSYVTHQDCDAVSYPDTSTPPGVGSEVSRCK